MTKHWTIQADGSRWVLCKHGVPVAHHENMDRVYVLAESLNALDNDAARDEEVEEMDAYWNRNMRTAEENAFDAVLHAGGAVVDFNAPRKFAHEVVRGAILRTDAEIMGTDLPVREQGTLVKKLAAICTRDGCPNA